jgi:cytochrome c553
MRQWQPNDLFWIVRNGFKFTGHAHWVAIEREDEIWAVVAFLTQIQKLDAKAYRDLALGNVHLSQTSGAELATLESVPRASSACARCHGDEGQWPLSNVVPILHGQPAVLSPRLAQGLCRRQTAKRNHATIGGGSRPGGYA